MNQLDESTSVGDKKDSTSKASPLDKILGLDKGKLEKLYLDNILKSHGLPGETYFASIYPGTLPEYPYNSLRIGPEMSVNPVKGGDRPMRPVFFCEEQETHPASKTSRPILPEQEENEVFYGYVRQDEVSRLPKKIEIAVDKEYKTLTNCFRLGKEYLTRGGTILVPVFVVGLQRAREREKKAFAPGKKPGRYANNHRVVPKPEIVMEPRPPKSEPVGGQASEPQEQEKAASSQNIDTGTWTEGDKVLIRIANEPVVFFKYHDLDLPQEIEPGEYLGTVESHRNQLWLEIHCGTREFYKSLPDALMLRDFLTITSRES